METQTTETSENSALLTVTNSQTTETSEQSALPQVTNMETPDLLEQATLPPVTNTQTIETLEHSALPSVTNTQATETSEQSTLPMVTITQETETFEQSTLRPVISSQTTETSVTNAQTTEALEQSALPPVTNTQTTETSEHPAMPCEVTDNSHDNLVPSLENHEGMEMRLETAEEEEVRSILKVIAATGKFWQDWDKLRSMLSIHLKQVLSEYPQAKMTAEEQKFSLGETHAELVKRLDDALHSFDEGPPFTLQRLSEIILDAQSLYPNLSKLALALEKNLSVTSTLTISSDPYQPTMVTPPNGTEQQQSDAVVENGVQPVVADRDEIMTDVEADVMTMDMETYERPSESSSMTTGIGTDYVVTEERR